MKEIKDLFENYEQQPSADVWDRLSARLDAEMPVARNVPKRRMSIVWKWVAAAVGTVAVAGICFLVATMFVVGDRYHAQDENVVETEAAPTPEAVAVESEAVAVESEAVAVTTEEPLLAEHHAKEEAAPVVVKKSAEVDPAAPAPKPAVTNVAKSNVRQEVLPANSTLAKQLAEDPVLKNLSDGSVDWSKPAHLSIPNLFTPNADGVNDKFVIEGIEQYKSPKLLVRDKNGRVVYQSDDYQNTWGGENCPDGLYNYVFTFSYNGIENQATGKVRIIRSKNQ